jgi:hypothetical protein
MVKIKRNTVLHKYLPSKSLPTHRHIPSGFTLQNEEFHLFMSNESTGVHKTGLNVLWLQPRVAFEYGFNPVASRKHAENMFNSKPPPSNDWFTAKYRGVHHDTIQQLLFVHHLISPSTDFAIRRSSQLSQTDIPYHLMLHHFGMSSILSAQVSIQTPHVDPTGGQGDVRREVEF